MAFQVKALRPKEKRDVIRILGLNTRVSNLSQTAFTQYCVETEASLDFVVIVFVGIDVADRITDERDQPCYIRDIPFDRNVVGERNPLRVFLGLGEQITHPDKQFGKS